MERLEGGSRWTLWKRVAARFRKHAEESSLRDIQRESLAPIPDHRKDSRQNPFRCRQHSRHDLRIARRQRHWRGCAAIRPAPRILRNCRLRFLMLFSIHRRGGLPRKCLRNKRPGSKIALDAAPGASGSTKLVQRHHCPRCRYSDCANARPFGRAEFARTTPSHGRVAS